jgi:hypothetical protein
MRVVDRVGRLQRKGRRRQFPPLACRPVAPPQFGAEMPKIERGVEMIAALQYRADRVAEEVDFRDVPNPVPARQLEQALAGPDIKPLDHRSLRCQPPVSAWKT